MTLKPWREIAVPHEDVHKGTFGTVLVVAGQEGMAGAAILAALAGFFFFRERIGMGWVRGVEIIAIISTMLGFFNLLPIPALDGGRLVFLGWEMITRRPVSQRVEQVVHTIGMVLLLALVAFLLVRGIWRKFG